MASESIAHSAFGLMGYWLTAHLGSRNNCYKVTTATDTTNITHAVNLLLQKFKLCSFGNLISQKFSDAAVIFVIAVSKRCTQDLPVVDTQGSRTGFLFTYHSAIPEKFSQRILFEWNSTTGEQFSINFLSSSAFLAVRQAREQDVMSSSVSVVRRLENF